MLHASPDSSAICNASHAVPRSANEPLNNISYLVKTAKLDDHRLDEYGGGNSGPVDASPLSRSRSDFLPA